MHEFSHISESGLGEFLQDSPNEDCVLGGNMDILSALKSEASKLEKQLNTINAAMEILGGKNGSDGRSNGRRKKRHFSAASKAKMAASQKARWAKIKAAK